MKKLFAWVLALAMLCACVPVMAEETVPVNLLANPGFETGDFSGKWLNYYHYDQIEENTLYAEIIEDAHSGQYAALTKSASMTDGQPESEGWLSALGIEATEAITAAGNGEYFFKAFVKLAEEGKLGSCDAWLYFYEQGRENDKYSPIQVWKLESNTPVDGSAWTEVGLDEEDNDKSFQLWYNNGVDRDGKAPTEQAGSRLIRTDDFQYTHVILWVTCGVDGAAAIPYELDDAQLFCVNAQ